MTEYLVRLEDDGGSTLYDYWIVSKSSKNGYLWKSAHQLAVIREEQDCKPSVYNMLKIPLPKKYTLSFRHQYMHTNPDGFSYHVYKRDMAYVLRKIEDLDDVHRDILLSIEAGGRRDEVPS